MILKYPICNRRTGEILFTASIECKARASGAVKRGLAAKWAVKRDKSLAYADLHSAKLYRAALRQADLLYADLCKANMYRACLFEVNLSQACLQGAHLFEADLYCARWTPTDAIPNIHSAVHAAAKTSDAPTYADLVASLSDDRELIEKCGNVGAACAILAESDPAFFDRPCPDLLAPVSDMYDFIEKKARPT